MRALGGFLGGAAASPPPHPLEIQPWINAPDVLKPNQKMKMLKKDPCYSEAKKLGAKYIITKYRLHSVQHLSALWRYLECIDKFNFVPYVCSLITLHHCPNRLSLLYNMHLSLCLFVFEYLLFLRY